MSASFLRRTRGVAVVATTLALGASGLAGATAASAKPASAHLPSGRYIVLLDDPSAASYSGGIDGLAATKARPGKKFDAHSAAAVRYTEHLRTEQSALLRRVGADATQRYTVTLNGFAADLTGTQASTLSRSTGVLAVVKDQLAKPDTVSSPRFLGLENAAGNAVAPWGKATAGKGVVIGDVDSGYWPENPSFSGSTLPAGSTVSAGAPGPIRLTSDAKQTRFAKADGQTFHGYCQAGEQFGSTTCNTKVISARYFADGFSANVKKSDWSKTEYKSPRDGGGHGSHTASTAAGNADTKVTIDGIDFGNASGMAPAAKIAVYKVCWEAKTVEQTGCYNSDSVAAIDQAVTDGVDVINFSISGTLSNPIDAVEMAFFGAAQAGVFVAASAGNSGPTASTVAHPSPWLTTVAASTHAVYEGTVVLANGAMYKGASTTANGVSAPLVLSTAVVAAGASATQGALCYPGTLDPAKVTGKIVVCNRGVIARVDKSAAVKSAGGLGMILANTSPSSLDADLHTVQTVHVDQVAGAAIKSYVTSAGAGARATLAKGDITGGPATQVPQIAPFSSRGPSAAASGDLLKPDISAPGVSVIAAVAPPSNSGRLWDFYSGTSMASPHIAGLAAYYLGEHPTWSPMAVKSAMMTTAYDLKTSAGGAYTDPFGEGAGHVKPTAFFDPGVVFDSNSDDWWAYLAGQGVTYGDGTPVSSHPIDASDLNVPSLAIGDLAGTQTVTRKITNVTATAETYTPVYSGSGGITITPEQSSYPVPAGATVAVKLTVRATGTNFASYDNGFVTFTGDKGHVARIPVAVQPLRVKAPAEVTSTVAAGTVTITGTSGFTGTLGTSVTGLVGSTPLAQSVAVGGFDSAAPAPSAAAIKYELAVPAGQDIVRFDVDAANNGDDLDLYVYRKNADNSLTLVAQSATGSADERVTLTGPAAATNYVAFVAGFASTTGTSSAYSWNTWVVPNVDGGNLTLSPPSQAVTTGGAFSIEASYPGLDATKKYLGRVTYLQDSTPAGSTIVSIG